MLTTLSDQTTFQLKSAVTSLPFTGRRRYFTATLATPQLELAARCIQANCALVGGETAETPGLYRRGKYDASGAAGGTMFPRFQLPRKNDVIESDLFVGIASNGVHSNGFSLVR